MRIPSTKGLERSTHQSGHQARQTRFTEAEMAAAAEALYRSKSTLHHNSLRSLRADIHTDINLTLPL